MPTTLKIRRSGTASATPSSLEHGEIAINYADGKVFWKNASDVITSFTFQAYALASHTHAASDITSGTLDIARIANDAVTYAKLQNVSATDRLLGRSSAGAGDVEEITCTAFGRSLIDDADAAAARTTLSVQPTASPAFTGAATFDNTGNVVPVTITNAGTANSFVVNDASGDTTPFVIDASGVVTCGGQLLVTAGSVSACSVAPSGDANTGVYFPAADTVALVTGGGERMRVDASGNVGIGVSPSYRFHASGNYSGASNIGIYSNNSGGAANRIALQDTATTFTPNIGSVGNHITVDTVGTERLRIGDDGSLKAPDVYGDTVGATNRDLFIDNTGLIGYVSSIRASKTDIVSLDDVSWLSALTPVSYRYRRRNEDGTYSDETDGVTDYGLIAEDVEAVRPELCFYDQADGTQELRGVTYSKLITPMLRYIQQLEQRIAALEERLNHA